MITSPNALFDFVVASPSWETLPKSARQRLSREMLDWTLSQLIHGEELSLLVCERLATSAAPQQYRSVAREQAADERRHRDRLRAYRRHALRRAAATLYVDWCPTYAALLRHASWDESILGLQVIGEWLFMGHLRRLSRCSTDATLKKVLAPILADEARHHRAGLNAAARFSQEDGTAAVRRRQRFALAACRSLVASFPKAVFERAGIEPSSWQSAARSGRRHRFSPLLRHLRRLGMIPSTLELAYAALELV